MPWAVRLTSGSIEGNYTVTGLGDSSAIAYVENQYPGAWVGNLPTGQWISPVDATTGQPSQQIGLFSYTRKIDGFGSLSGEFASDNGGALFVNGILVANTAGWEFGDDGDYRSFINFSATLNQAVNTITFEVYNTNPDISPNPTGLIVAGTAEGDVSVPDGGMTVMLLGGALVGLGALSRKLFV